MTYSLTFWYSSSIAYNLPFHVIGSDEEVAGKTIQRSEIPGWVRIFEREFFDLVYL